MERDLAKKVQRSQKLFIMIIAILVFGALLYYIFFMSKGTAESVSTDKVSIDDSYQQYKDYISNTNNGIKSLLEGKQMEQIDLKEYSPGSQDFERNNNIFVKPF